MVPVPADAALVVPRIHAQQLLQPAPVVARPGPLAGPLRRSAESRIVLRCTPEYHDWVRRLADHLGTTLTTAITAGLMTQADLTGFSRPPRRYARKLDPDLDA